MIDQKPSHIDEPPSLDDIRSASDRVGQVDFSQRLSGADASDTAEHTELPPESVATLRTVYRSEDGAEASSAASLLILPPAKVDEAMAAEVARIKAENEPEDELDHGPDDELELADDSESAEESDDDNEDDAAHDDAALAAPETVAVPAADEEPVQERRNPLESLVIEEVADLDAIGADESAKKAEADADAERLAARAAEDAAEAAALAAELEAEQRLAEAVEPVDLHGAPDPADRHDDVPAPLADSGVEEVAASIIAAMRAAGEAHQRHLEALEEEAARRCELLTAQAELDAELIRLHGRREAHSIISAARARVGEPGDPSTESTRLNEIGETFSRFAETIETTVASAPEFPDHTRKP